MKAERDSENEWTKEGRRGARRERVCLVRSTENTIYICDANETLRAYTASPEIQLSDSGGRQ